MIAARDLRQNAAFFNAAADALADEKIVDAPPRVVGAGVVHVAPPGIGASLVRIQVAERIHKAAGEQFRELCALLIREARIAAVGFCIF